MEFKKSWLKSKTVWLNVIGGAIAIVQALQGQPWIDPEIQVLILSVLNGILRFITKQPIGK